MYDQSSMRAHFLQHWPDICTKHSFSFAASFLWNTLPKEMHQPSADDISVCLALTRGPFHKRLKLISSPSHIHLSSLHLFHHCTWNSTRNAHGLRFTINEFTPLPTNPVMPGRWRRSLAMLILISALGTVTSN